ncbi:31 kDa ribonucleoprotein, chloroplastic-like [Iris pallida]|uniref:31 kDa ribonucleoprotein, chloroplastic-like n=1 Tax=Iris pallida TaxID=29817 RepID=A0AAX6IEB9_IRIPA|nr:31 kDa ribonucleoprotein, chloroplastic-like [Iris pallida]
MAAAATTTLLLFSSNSNLIPRPRISNFAPKLSSNSHLIPSLSSSTKPLSPFLLRCSAVQHTAAADEATQAEEVKEEEGGGGEEEEGEEKRKKLFVVNLPWDFSAPDIEKLFGECGTVKDVEIIKQKNGKSRGFAFITMSSGDEARAVAEKFNSYELMGRVISVEFAKSFRKPSPPPAPGASVVDGRHKIYVSNLAWKVRSINLRNFFSAKFKPVSTRVVFDSPTGKSAGYGFVGFSTKEEAEAAVSELNGKELMGRPLRLRISEKKGEESGDESEITEKQPEEI